MLDALYKGMTGLLGFSKSLDNLSNNVANLNTPGFKGNDLFFRELNTGQGGGQSLLSNGQPDASGSGVTVAGSSIRFTQGDFLKTGGETDLAVDGQGLFVLLDGDTEYYTRAGQFRFDSDGYLVEPATGHRVGFLSRGGQLGDFSLDSVQLSEAVATTSVKLTGTLDGTLSTGTQFPTDTGTPIGLKIFDSEGRLTEVFVRFTAQDGDQWKVDFVNDKGIPLAPSKTFEFTSLGEVFDSQDTLDLSFTPYSLVATADIPKVFTPGNAMNFAQGFSTEPKTGFSFTNGAVVLRNDNDVKLDSSGQYNFNTAGFLIDSVTGLTVAALNSSNKVEDFSIAGKLESPAVASTTVPLSGNLDPNVAVGQTFPPAGSDPLTVSYVNAAGETKILQTRFVHSTTTSWSMQMTDDTGASVSTSGSLNFDAQGNLQVGTSSLVISLTPSGGVDIQVRLTDISNSPTITSRADATTSVSFGASNGKVKGLLSEVEFDANGVSHLSYSNGDEIQGPKLALADPEDARYSNVSIDISGLRAGSAGQNAVSVGDSNGRAGGQVSLYAFDDTGTLTVTYSNGEKREVGQLALATVTDKSLLKRIGNTLYSINDISNRVLGHAGEGAFGSIKAENLELSNVELSREFSDIIIVQRGYQASSQILTVTNELIEELYNSTRGR